MTWLVLKVEPDMKNKISKWMAVALCLTMFACVTDAPNDGQPPVITMDTTVDQGIAAVRHHGPAVLPQVRKVFSSRGDWPEVQRKLSAMIPPLARSDQDRVELAHLVHLFQDSSPSLDHKIVTVLVQGRSPLARHLGWQLIANDPSPTARDLADQLLSQILIEGREADHLIAPLADAVAANRLATAYTVMRRGLMQTGDDSFAKAMISLNPTHAANDFLNYLAMAPIDELRQLNQTTVNMYTAMVALQHMVVTPPTVNHPRLGHLFFYAVSRNNALSELAHLVVERNYLRERQQVASVLAGLDPWIQISYIEGAKRNLTPNTRLLLGELSQIAVQREVLDELRGFNRERARSASY